MFAALASHVLAGGRVMGVIEGLISAMRSKIDLEFVKACAIDLATLRTQGKSVTDAVTTSVNPRVIDCPDTRYGRSTFDGVARDGIQLKAKARVTVRTNLDLARPSGHTHADWGGHKPTIYKHAESLIMAIEHNVKPLTMADVVDGARAVAVALAAEESLRTGQPASVRQYAPLDAYDENAPQPGIDDYFGSVLGKYFYLQERGSLRTLLFA